MVIDLDQLQTSSPKEIPVQFGRGLAQAVHDVEHVGSRFAIAVDRQTDAAEVLHHRRGFLVSQPDLCDVANVDGSAVGSLRDDDVGHLIGFLEAAQSTNHVPPLAFPQIARGHVAVLSPQGPADVKNRHAPSSQSLRVDDDLHLFFSAAKDIRIRDTGDALEAGFDEIFDE